ncbi:MAG: EamA family transporter [Bacteroidales bacterium]
MMLKKTDKVAIQWIIMIALAIVWGSSYILMKRGLEFFPAMQVGALRITISFLFLLPFALWRIKRVKKENLKYLVIVGFLGSGIPAFLFAEAQTGLDSQIAGIINSVAPLFVLIFGTLFFNVRVKWYNVAGVFIGLSGAIGLLSACGNKSFDSNLGFGIYIIIATMLYSININVIKKYLKETDSLTITAISFIFIGVPSIIYLMSGTDFITRLSETPGAMKGMGYLSLLAILGTALAGILYNYLIKISSVLFSASVTYIIPIVAIMWGTNDGEHFYLGYIIWIALIFSGIFLVNKEISET